MLRRLHLILAAIAMMVAPLAMQSGVAVAAMPMDHHEMVQAGHCGEDGAGEDEPGAMTQCCVAMCSAVAPLGASSLEQIVYHASIRGGFRPTQHRPFLAELPTPPPRLA